jgi:hypothetical protein
VPTPRPSRLRRALRLPRLALLGTALLAGAACTPEHHIHSVFGAKGPEAERVAWCESRLDPGAVSPTNDHGLFQINARYHRTGFQQVTGQPWEMVYDAFWNTVYAKHLYDTQGWQPWTCRHAA